MTNKEVFDMLASTKIPTVYYSWKIGNAPALPYIVYYYPESDDFIADNINFQSINALNIELYTQNKDFATEQIVEDVLKANKAVLDKLAEELLTHETLEEKELEPILKAAKLPTTAKLH